MKVRIATSTVKDLQRGKINHVQHKASPAWMRIKEKKISHIIFVSSDGMLSLQCDIKKIELIKDVIKIFI